MFRIDARLSGTFSSFSKSSRAKNRDNYRSLKRKTFVTSWHSFFFPALSFFHAEIKEASLAQIARQKHSARSLARSHIARVDDSTPFPLLLYRHNDAKCKTTRVAVRTWSSRFLPSVPRANLPHGGRESRDSIARDSPSTKLASQNAENICTPSRLLSPPLLPPAPLLFSHLFNAMSSSNGPSLAVFSAISSRICLVHLPKAFYPVQWPS